jgi:cytochrome c553
MTRPDRIFTARSLIAGVLVIAVAVVLAASPVVSATAAAVAEPDASRCIVCHGPHGGGASEGVPRLAAQDAGYLGKALSMFKAGTRASVVMQPIARSLSEAEIGELSTYFSKQSAPLADASVARSPRLVSAGGRLAETGAGNVAACFSCHGPQGKGVGARFPSIAGQPAKYIVDRLHEFQARARANTPQAGSMTAVAAPMDEAQIEQAAAYLSTLDR